LEVRNESSKRIKVEVFSSSTLTRPYIDCVRSFQEFWTLSCTEKVSFRPVVFLVESGIEATDLVLAENLQTLQRVRANDSLVTASQFVRLLACAFSKADFALVSDIDMVPLRASYFEGLVITSMEQGSDFTVARDILGPTQYPICYTVVRPAAMRVALAGFGLLGNSVQETLDIFLSRLPTEQSQTSLDKRKMSWYADQIFLRKLIDVHERKGGSVLRLSDEGRNFRRLDRAYHPILFRRLWKFLDSKGWFTDYHVHGSRARTKLLSNLLANRVSQAN
jgi:hypothetical protein